MPQAPSPTVRPRLMPHRVRLPLGVTACVLPAGMYLCCQTDYDRREPTLQRMLGSLQIVPEFEMTEEEEVRRSEALAAKPFARRGFEEHRPGAFEEPFAMPRDWGDPDLFGYVRDLNHRDLTNLALPNNMGLAPENGRVVISSSAPLPDARDQAIDELQVFVDAQKIPPPEEGVP